MTNSKCYADYSVMAPAGHAFLAANAEIALRIPELLTVSPQLNSPALSL
jgi:hypothetical protein